MKRTIQMADLFCGAGYGGSKATKSWRGLNHIRISADIRKRFGWPLAYELAFPK